MGESKEAMDKAYWYTTVGAAVMSIVLVVLWPALALPADPFSKSYFTWWVTIAFIWGHFAFVVTGLLRRLRRWPRLPWPRLPCLSLRSWCRPRSALRKVLDLLLSCRLPTDPCTFEMHAGSARTWACSLVI